MSKKTLMELTIAAFSACDVTYDKISAVTCQQLWDCLDPADQGQFCKGVSAINDQVYKLINKGWIVKGETVYNKSNRSIFTYYKSKTWPFISDADVLPVDDEPLTDTDQSIKDVFNDDAWVDVPAFIGFDEGETAIKDVFDDASWSGLEPDKFKDFLDNPGCIKDVPDMVKVEFDYDHNGVTIPVQFYFSAEIPASPAPVSIARKKEKLAVLQHFKQFVAVVNTDFERVIDDIILDLNQLVEVE